MSTIAQSESFQLSETFCYYLGTPLKYSASVVETPYLVFDFFQKNVPGVETVSKVAKEVIALTPAVAVIFLPVAGYEIYQQPAILNSLRTSPTALTKAVWTKLIYPVVSTRLLTTYLGVSFFNYLGQSYSESQCKNDEVEKVEQMS